MTTRRTRKAAILAAMPALALTLAACGSAASASHRSPVGPAGAQRVAAATARPRGAAVAVRASQYGRILIDGSGRTLYLFTRDSSQKSRCYGGCASVWPPYLTAGQPTVTGVPASLLGTTRRSNGARQVTYAGHPLYHYTGDRKPGDVLCQAVSEFGGGWYVVSPSGSAIR